MENVHGNGKELSDAEDYSAADSSSFNSLINSLRKGFPFRVL